MIRVRTIDAHVAGASLRLIVDGFPRLRGATLDDQQREVMGSTEDLRSAVLREPRGHRDLMGAVLTEAGDPAAAAGVLFFTAETVGAFRGHDVIAAVTTALERGLLVPRSERTFVLETSVGLVRVDPTVVQRGADRRVRQVTYLSPASFVARAALPVDVDGRQLRIDIVWVAGWYAIVDREAIGVPPEPGNLDGLRRAAQRLIAALHPRVREWPAPEAAQSSLIGVVLTGPPGRSDADLRSIVVYADGTVDRSPSGCGTAAVLTVLDAMGIVESRPSVTHEGVSGQCLRAEIAERTMVDDLPGIVAAVTGKAWITGEHTFLLDEQDPLVTGFDF